MFDVIYCLNVLEHLPLRKRERFYGVCAKTLAPGGSVVVDVPLELGLSLAIKEAGRLLLKGRQAEYTVPQLVKTMAGQIPPDPERMGPEHTEFIRTHRNFDHRLLAAELAEHFPIERTFYTPFPRLSAGAGNQEQYLRALTSVNLISSTLRRSGAVLRGRTSIRSSHEEGRDGADL